MTMSRLNRVAFRTASYLNAGLCGYAYALHRMGLRLPSGYGPLAFIAVMAAWTAFGVVIFFIFPAPEVADAGRRPGKGRAR